MENDYLWDKKGGDAEIEGLESLLSGFKYEPIAPPSLPAAVVISEPTRFPWWKFSLAFAVPACLLFVVSISFWFLRPGRESRAAIPGDEQRSTPNIIRNEPSAKNERETKVTEPDQPVTEPLKPIKTIFAPGRKPVAPRAVRTGHRKPKQQFETLTSEERFAYDQLKLALSITGSKLKVVSDTVNRTED